MESSVEKFKNYIDILKIELDEKIKNDARLGTFAAIKNNMLENHFVDSLINFLTDEYRKTNVESFGVALLSIKESLKFSDEEWLNNNIIFNEYFNLSAFLEISKLNVRDCLNVLNYFIKRDVIKFRHYGITLTDKDYIGLKPENISNQEFLNQVNYCFHILQKKKNLTESEKELFEYLKSLIDKKIEKPLTVISEQAIFHHYIEKENIDETDIKIVLQSLKNLGVLDSLIASIDYYLNKELKKQNAKEKSEEVVIKKNKPTYNYNELASLVNEFIDFTKMIPKRYLSLEERIYCLSILTKMNIPKEERRLFLRNCEFLSSNLNIITKYLEEYNKYKYYEEQVGLQKEIINMEEIFQELFICHKEDYTFWKSALAELMKQVESWIPKNYEYEENEVSRLLAK